MSDCIRSLQNNRVKNLVRLRNSSHRRRQKKFLVEGHREIGRALQCDWPVESLFFCSELFKSPEAFELVQSAEARGIELIQMTEDPFRKCAYREGADGLLAVARHNHGKLDSLIPGNPAMLIVLDSIEKPGNLGAIFRTADAAGIDGLIITGKATDPYNPNCIRSSQGAVFSLPFFFSETEPAIELLEKLKIQILATSPEGEKNIWEADMCRPTALIFGPEDVGLGDQWLANYEPYKLPMRGLTDSLNVASTVAIAIFEAVRQRATANP